MLFVAEFRKLIRAAIPQIITLLSDSAPYAHSGGADALAKLSEHGKVSNFLT